ncbi:MAG: T9SS type A sorting domain-containing protein [Bacteroidetes bacterium]|nr:T9SS type A sorting domain-containing protein [Bacteroidota bacterium]
MRAKLFKLLIITSVIVSLTITYFSFNYDDKQNSEFSLKEYNNDLSDRISHLPSDSEDAAKLINEYNRVRAKVKGVTVDAENPGNFLEALHEIKTAFNGSTYKSNYKIKALKKSTEMRRLLKGNAAEDLNWVNRGPGNVAGRTQQLLVDPTDNTGATFFAATVGGGVWKTTNSGVSWINKTPELATLSTTSIDIARSNTNVMYVGTGMGFGRVVDLAGSGIWKSTDHGETWFQLESTANNELYAAVNRLIVSPEDENLVLVCGNNDYTSYGPNGGSRESGIFRTTDGGTSWSKVFDPDAVIGANTDNRVQHIVANPNDFNVLYASVNEVGVVKSTDSGVTWSVSAGNMALPSDIGTNEGTYQGISTRIELAVAPSDPNRVYAAVERPVGIADLYMTKDAGASWTLVTDTGNDPNWFSSTSASGAVTYTAGWFNNTIAVSPYDENVVIVGGVEIYRINVNPNNNTRTTTEIGSTQAVHADHHDLDLIPVNALTGQFTIINSNDGGIAISYNGGATWTARKGLGSTQFYGVDKKPGADAYFGGTQDNGTWQSGNSPDANSLWNYKLSGDGFEAAWNYANPNILIGGSQNGGLSRSTDGGITFTAIPESRAGNAPFITKIASSKADPDLVFTVGTSGIKRSDDFGASWTLTPVPGNWIGDRAFDNVEISLADPQIVWITSALDTKPWLGRPGGIHVSRDAGLSFTEISNNFPDEVTEASGVATDPFDPNTAYVLFSAVGTPKILKTTDLGTTWTDISGFGGSTGSINKSLTSENLSSNGFPDVAVFSLLVMPYNTDIIWAGTEIGLFVSEDAGASWLIAENGLPKVGVFQMFIQDEQVVVATYGRGIWTVNLPELSGHAPQVVALSPRMNPLVQQTSGDVEINIDLRSPYDSTKVFVNGNLFELIPANPYPVNRKTYLSVSEPATFTIQLKSYAGGEEYISPVRSIFAEPIPAVIRYVNDFNSELTESDFTGNLFSIRSYTGFSNNALHSAHPYGNANEFIYKLKYPVIVSSQNATLSYDDVAIIELGAPGFTDYQNVNFFDYVIVEASRDGITWLPLLNGYDAGFDPVWTNTYNAVFNGNDSTTPGNGSMFRNHNINLLNTFNAGERIFIRFRLHADGAAVAWGWAIDNLQIQPNASGVDDEEKIPTQFTLNQNYPNPFNPSTVISFTLPKNSNVDLTIYNINGEVVRSLVNENMFAGTHKVTWNGDDNAGAKVSSGVYFYLLRSGDFTASRKMILLK